MIVSSREILLNMIAVLSCLQENVTIKKNYDMHDYT